MSIRLYENLMTPFGTMTSDATNPATGGTFVLGANTYTFKTTLTEAKATSTVTASSIVNGNTLIIDGQTYTFKTSLASEAPATVTLTSDATAPSNNDTVTIDTTTYTYKTSLTEVRATQTVTSDATNVSDAETCTIGNKVYTFKTALTPTEGQVLIGASASATLDNLKAAINHTGTPDTDYKCAAAHTQVRATTKTATTLLVESLASGTAANAYATTETSAHLSWGAATMTGGVAAVVNQVLIGASAAIALDNIKLAVLGSAVTQFSEEYSTGTVVHTTVEATTNTNTTQVFSALTPGTGGNSIVVSEASTHLGFGSETLLGGVSDAANQILLGANDAAALDNMKVAINEGTGKGVKYSSLTVAHLSVTATTNTDTAQTIQSTAIGIKGNGIRLTGTGTTLVWSTAYLTGGVNPVANEIFIGTDAATTLDNVKKAINATGTVGTEYSTLTVANPKATATTNTDTTQLFNGVRTGVFNDVLFSESATHITADGNGSLINKFVAGEATYNADFSIPDGTKAANLLLDILEKTGTLTFDCKIQSRDPVTGTCVDIPGGSFAQKSAAFTGVLSIYPGLTASANVAVTQVLPKDLRVVVVVGGSSTPTATFSLLVEPLV